MEENRVHSTSDDVDNGNGERKKRNVGSLISDYAEQTTLHGLYYLIHGGNKIRQLVWLVFISCCFAYLTYNTAVLFGNFLEHKKLTQSEVITKRKMLFPAITICNYNPIRKTRKQAVVKQLNGNKKANASEKSPNVRSSGTNNFHFGETSFNRMDIGTLYEKSGHTIEEDGMLVGCKWKGKACTAIDFRSTAQAIGLCHTFNSGHKNYTQHYINSPGESSGLLLTLNVQTEEYLESTETIGVKVQIHNQDEPILIKEKGFAVMPGRKALVSVKKKEVRFLPPPHGERCISDDGNYYSEAHCLNDCKERYVGKICGCQIPSSRKKFLKVCNGIELRECYYKIEEKFYDKNEVENCNCVEACRKITYETQLSYAQFKGVPNTTALQNQFRAYNLSTSEEKYAERTKWREFLSDNILQLSIYFDELSYVFTEDLPAYSWESFIAEAGGTIGLCLGASFLTITELLDLICRLFILLGKKRRN